MAIRKSTSKTSRGAVPLALYEPLHRLGDFPTGGSASSRENYLLASMVYATGHTLRGLRAIAAADSDFADWRAAQPDLRPRDPYFRAEQIVGFAEIRAVNVTAGRRLRLARKAEERT